MKKNIYTVERVNAYIKNMFDQDFMMNQIYVKGEASNVKYHPSGHIYFTLKDESASIQAVMFAGNRKNMDFHMNNGDRMIVLGSVSVYEREGRYQLYAREISLDGAGVLYTRFLALKKELEEMGMFAPEYKQPIPAYIKTLGIVTAKTGAAIRDIQSICARRNPYVQLLLYPAQVQGDKAAASIVKGIQALAAARVDLIIVGRGGGSIEDLWAFNEELVARAIFDCPIPIISAVGHETDTTIADFVADLRAPTPSAAAELAVYDINAVQSILSSQQRKMNQLLQSRLILYQTQIAKLEMKLKYLSPINKIKEKRRLWIDYSEKLNTNMEQRCLTWRHRLAMTAERLAGLSPLQKMAQGYSFVADETGRGISDIERLRIGDVVKIHMHNGVADAIIKKKEHI